MAEIKPPEIETKIQIIIQKCQDNKIQIQKDIIYFLAENISDNIRQIEGIIQRLNFNSQISNNPISITMAKNALKDIKQEQSNEITLEQIINHTARELNIKPSEIMGKSKISNIVKARQISIYLTRTLSKMDTTTILAKKLNMKDHSAISKSYKIFENKIKKDENLKILVNNIKIKIQNEQKQP